MPTVNKTFQFASNLEGLFEIGLSSGITLAFDGTDGSPAGSAKWTITQNTIDVEKARTNVAFTWEDFGVPQNSCVTHVQLTAMKIKSLPFPRLAPPIEDDFEGRVTVRFICAAMQVGDNIYQTEEMYPLGWVDVSGPLVTIPSQYGSWNTAIQLEVIFDYRADNQITFSWAMDEITIAITYTGGLQMPERATVYEASQIGVEVTPGTPVAATKRLLCTEINPDPNMNMRNYRPMGFKFNTGQARGKEHTNISYQGDLCFNDLAYILSALLKQAAISTPANNSIWRVNGSAGTIGFSVVDGADTQVLAAASFATAASLQTALEALTNVGKGNVLVTMTAANDFNIEFVAGRSGDDITLTTPTGTGTPTLTAGSSTAGSVRKWLWVPSYIAPDTLQTFTLEKGVYGVANYAQQIAYMLFNSMTLRINENECTMSGDGFGFKMNESPESPFSMTVLTPTADVKSTPVDPAEVSVFISTAAFVDPAAGASNPGRLLRPLEFELGINNRQKPVFTMNDQDTSFSAVVETSPQIDVRLVVEHDTQGQQLVYNAKQELVQYLTLEARGPAISGSGNAIWRNRLKIQIPVKWHQPDRGDSDGVYSTTLNGSAFYDGGTGKGNFAGGISFEVDVDFAAL